MRTNLIVATAAAALLCSAGAMAQTVPPGTAEPVPPIPGSIVPGAVQDKPTTRPDAVPDILTPTQPAMTRTSAERLLGRTAVGADGKELGEVQDVILNASSGDAEKLIIGSGGFMGLGEKSIAVDVADADLLAGNSQVTVRNLTQAQVERMAEYEYGKDTRSLVRTEKR